MKKEWDANDREFLPGDGMAVGRRHLRLKVSTQMAADALRSRRSPQMAKNFNANGRRNGTRMGANPEN